MTRKICNIVSGKNKDTRNVEIFPGSGPELGNFSGLQLRTRKFSGFRPETWKIFRVPIKKLLTFLGSDMKLGYFSRFHFQLGNITNAELSYLLIVNSQPSFLGFHADHLDWVPLTQKMLIV